MAITRHRDSAPSPPLFAIDFHLVLQTDRRMRGVAGEAVSCSVLSSLALGLEVGYRFIAWNSIIG